MLLNQDSAATAAFFGLAATSFWTGAALALATESGLGLAGDFFLGGDFLADFFGVVSGDELWLEATAARMALFHLSLAALVATVPLVCFLCV